MRRRLVSYLLLALALAACRSGAPATSAPAPRAAPVPEHELQWREPGLFPTGWRFQPGARAAFGRSAMVATDDPYATAVGLEVLKNGGNAIDAAVAIGFAMAVTYPEAGNLGGGGYMVIRMADGRTAALDYREVAPLAARRDMYLDSLGNLTDKSVTGHLASGVPGAVAGMVSALAQFGTRPLRELLAPAIQLADEGFVVDSGFSRIVAAESLRIVRFPSSASVFLPDGRVPVPGTRFRQPDLARTLRLLAARGSRAFYEGAIADSLVAEMGRGGGIISRRDLARYTPVWRAPVRSTYRGHTLISMPPSSSGGVTMAEALNILETYDRLPPFGSAAYFHVVASAFQRAFIDRNERIADPAFAPVPIAELTSKEYARRLRGMIADRSATPTPQAMREMHEGTHTTHYSVVDQWGNAVSTTTTINSLFGSAVLVRGAGFFLNNEMDDLSAQPGKPNQFGLVQGEANAVEPGKRPLSAMSPSIVLDPAGRLLLVLGSRGGPRIITSTAQVILNVVENRMSLADAMSAPRIHHQALPDSLRFESGGIAPHVIEILGRMGHAPSAIGGVGLVNAIMRVPGGYEGVSDPRRPGRAAGY